MKRIPQPTQSAMQIYEVSAAIASTFIPGVAAAKPILDLYLKRKERLVQEVLIKEIHDRGIEALNDEQFEFYVPALYRFLEQVRIGEYEHNLKVLAALIADGLKQPAYNVSVIGRAARRLEMITIEELQTLAAAKIAMDGRVSEGPTLENELSINHLDILNTLAALGHQTEMPVLSERLEELCTRGLLRYSPPSGFFHGGFYPTSALAEIIDAVELIVKKADGSPIHKKA